MSTPVDSAPRSKVSPCGLREAGTACQFRARSTDHPVVMGEVEAGSHARRAGRTSTRMRIWPNDAMPTAADSGPHSATRWTSVRWISLGSIRRSPSMWPFTTLLVSFARLRPSAGSWPDMHSALPLVTTHSDDVDLTCPFAKGATGYLPYASGGGAQAPGWLRRRAS